MRYHLTLVRMAVIQEVKTECWSSCRIWKLWYITGHSMECEKKLLTIAGHDAEYGSSYTSLVMMQNMEALIHRWSCWRIWMLLYISGGVWINIITETVDRFFKVLKGHLPCNSAILLMSTYPRKYKGPAVLCLFWPRHNAKTANQLSCPSIDK